MDYIEKEKKNKAQSIVGKKAYTHIYRLMSDTSLEEVNNHIKL